MVCDICGKNQASVHLTEVINGQVNELHLCEDCAKQKGAQMEQHFGLADLLAGLADFGKEFEAGIEKKLKCPNCGLTYDDFKKIGRLGCSECYTVFKDSLAPLLKRIHGSAQHMGKTPVKTGVKTEVRTEAKAKTKISGKDEIEALKGELQRAIKMEEFEKAAKLRDKIRELEKRK